MDLVTAIKHAIDGNAVLFVGSGASVTAKPILGDKFLTGRELALHLSDLAKIVPLSDDLNFAAQKYRKTFGDRNLVDLLQNMFSASEVTEEHCRLSEIAWHGIYTTNYDNVLEKAFAQRRKKLTPLTPDQDTKNHISQKNTILHINGYIETLTPESLNGSFKLTNVSYLTEAFSKSNWAFMFRRKMEAAKAVIFVGYSMYDIDIQRIVFGSEYLKNKTVFIERPGKTKEEIECGIQIDFGEVFPVGMDGFFSEFDKIKDSYVPQDYSATYIAFEEIQQKFEPEQLRDSDVFELLFMGKVRSDVVWSTVAGNMDQPYYIVREQMERSISAIAEGMNNIIAVSDLANGKSLFCLGLSCKLASSNYRVFWLKDDVEEVGEEIDWICDIPGKVALVVENYSRRFDEIRHIQLKRSSDTVLILSSKSSQHEVHQIDLADVLDSLMTFEVDLNMLNDSDLDSFQNLLDIHKLWGDRDALPAHKKRKFIVNDCGRELSGVLLDVVKSHDIQQRFKGLFSSFQKNTEVADVIVAVSVLKLLGFNKPKQEVVSELLNSNYLYSLDFRQNAVVRDLLSFSSPGTVVAGSSILARYGLTSFSDGRKLVERLIRIATTAHNLGRDSQLYFGIYKDLVTFSILQSMLPEKGKRDSLIRFYEGVKNLSLAKTHPHFWLQYAIARLTSDQPDDLHMAKLYLDSAYAQADKRVNYDKRRHLDNVLARYWIQHSLTVSEIKLAMLELFDGHKLLMRQAEDKKNHSPYKVARMYRSFYDAKRSLFTEDERSMLKRVVLEVLNSIENLPNNVQEHISVKVCKSELEGLFSDLEGAGLVVKEKEKEKKISRFVRRND